MNILQVAIRPARLSPLMISVLGALLIFASLTGFYAFHSIMSPLAIDPVSRSEWRAPTVANESAAASPAHLTDAQTLTRPIFSKSRRPDVHDDQHARESLSMASPPPLPTGLIVRAVVVLGENKSAYVVCDSFPDGKWMKEGESIQNWTISAVHDLYLILKNGEHTSQLILDYSEKGLTPPETRAAESASDPVFVREAKGRR
jgi:hypothetical protein